MDKVEVTEKNIERQFILAVEFFGMYFPNMLHFYALFHKRANNKIKSLRLAVRTGVTPYIEYNEEWLCNCESGLFSFILAIELYRFINHHCTHRLLTGENAYKASTAVCNTKDLKICLRNVSKEVNDFLEKNIWSRKLIEAELGKPVPDGEFYYEAVYNLLNQKAQEEAKEQAKQQAKQQENQNDEENENEEGEESEGQGSQSESEDSDEEEGKEDSKSGSGEGGSEEENPEQEGDGDDSEESEGEDSDDESRGTDGDDSRDDGSEDEEDNEGTGESESSQSGDSSQNGDDRDPRSGKGTGSPDDSESSAGSDIDKNDQSENFQDWNQSGEENTEEWGQNDIVDEMIRDTIENKCKPTGWGKLSGDSVEQIMINNRRKVNITRIITGFAASVRSRKRCTSRLRWNKRYNYLPGYRYDRKTRILFAIDSSGSMSEKDISRGCEILHNFYKKTEIDVAFWDAKMLKPFKLKRNVTKMDAPGRGGTDPACIGEYLKENNLRYDGVVIFTDCYWSWEKNNLGSHIFIISSEEEYKNRIPKFVKHHASIQELTHVWDD